MYNNTGVHVTAFSECELLEVECNRDVTSLLCESEAHCGKRTQSFNRQLTFRKRLFSKASSQSHFV